MSFFKTENLLKPKNDDNVRTKVSALEKLIVDIQKAVIDLNTLKSKALKLQNSLTSAESVNAHARGVSKIKDDTFSEFGIYETAKKIDEKEELINHLYCFSTDEEITERKNLGEEVKDLADKYSKLINDLPGEIQKKIDTKVAHIEFHKQEIAMLKQPKVGYGTMQQ